MFDSLSLKSSQYIIIFIITIIIVNFCRIEKVNIKFFIWKKKRAVIICKYLIPDIVQIPAFLSGS